MNQAMKRGELMRVAPTTTQWFAELAQGEVDQPIASSQPGRIRFQRSFWKAELADSSCRSVKSGESVRVVGRLGITLLVVPIESAVPSQREKVVQVDWTQKIGSAFAVVAELAIALR
ncbi:MAG: NfeD family protein [Drouetiella hepatica Uher 2000/2452]|jgi:membrane-bound ClpP family serine protease|uniref:NfeD family protein n=1 Tax=Drouetiella hepatica Uher 2000/2452 TaxID=904376 RepID=A0A951QD92_9CYAN|nr:NfeD family protein [Drouetiella hepatica Uher 2000/2452]